ncbi:nuclear receptor-interacting protein 2 [Spea bombifrons]|uniref:nuclear receptor-interacting protein 2 n=1 Tax=Spea bombifrons TaxID=233779 RepID=UPI00234AABE7|nr:nuclear receptor-interacting protein 2 [Spea bombifrons]
MSCQRHTSGLGGDGQLGNPSKKKQDMRGGALLHQQRRLKQTTQFMHKDSADLLPLDQLRMLGTSKDLQPHNVIQRRLLGGSPVREPSGLVRTSNLCDKGTQSPPEGKRLTTQQPCLQDEWTQPTQTSENNTGGWKGHSLFILCKVCTLTVRAKISIDHQENLISRSCVERLRLVASCQDTPSEASNELTVDIDLGSEKLRSKARIIDDDEDEFCLGLETLISLKSCIDLSKGILKTVHQEIHFLPHQDKEPTD